MPSPASGPRLEPLFSVCRRNGARHLSLFGSAVRRPLDSVGDLDLHLVVPRLDRGLYDGLRAAAEETARRLAGPQGRGASVELRHGPFKPPPGDPLPLQLHLVVDDETSLGRSTGILRAHRALSGRLLLGAPLEGLSAGRLTSAALLEEARGELARWRHALASRRLVFRHWRFDPEPRLADGWTPATTAWDLRCMLRGASKASDLHYLAAVRWVTPGDETTGTARADEAVARPLLSGLEDRMEAWRDLPAHCDGIVERWTAVLDRRLSHLGRLQAAAG